MTRERDRIQENANKYIVKNCPSYFQGGCYGCDNLCQNISNCVIKRAIEKLKNPNNRTYGGRPLVFTAELLQLFNIEEINK